MGCLVAESFYYLQGQEIYLFFTASRPALSPMQLPIQLDRGLFSWDKAAGA
jgi:hypothetical protein